jgi:hypothetical protein
MARSMMLGELQALIATVPASAHRSTYRSAIRDENVLGKPTFASRRKSEKHLVELYGLDPSMALFRVLRHLAAADLQSLPLLALVCAFCRDPQLRASFSLIEELAVGEVLPRERMQRHMEDAFPERYSRTFLASLAKNVNTTWTASGHLQGVMVKRRTLPRPSVAASSYTTFAGYLLGLRGEILASSVFARLVGAGASLIVEHLSAAARNAWLRFRHAGGVTEIDFSNLLLPDEKGLLHGAY